MSRIPGLYASPLRYPGGKGKVAPFVKALMLDNGFVGREYVEPYAGGASVALSLLFEEYVSAIHINDLNPGVHAFWKAVLTDGDAFCARIESTPITMREWHRQREIAASSSASALERGFATFFLNRTNRSGVIKGGVIGGKGQGGDWKLDARFSRNDLIERVQKIGRYRSRIRLSNLDAVEFLKPWMNDSTTSNAFIYLDPPYYLKGRGLYDNFYEEKDHQQVADAVGNLAHPWIVSYDDAPEIAAIYAQWNSIEYSLNYSMGVRGKGSEVMFFSPDISVPCYAPLEVTKEHIAQRRIRALEVATRKAIEPKLAAL